MNQIARSGLRPASRANLLSASNPVFALRASTPGYFQCLLRRQTTEVPTHRLYRSADGASRARTPPVDRRWRSGDRLSDPSQYLPDLLQDRHDQIRQSMYGSPSPEPAKYRPEIHLSTDCHKYPISALTLRNSLVQSVCTPFRYRCFSQNTVAPSAAVTVMKYISLNIVPNIRPCESLDR